MTFEPGTPIVDNPGIDTFLTDITTPIAFYDNFASNGEKSKVYPNVRDFCIKFLMEQI